jgi:hypothetical protein
VVRLVRLVRRDTSGLKALKAPLVHKDLSDLPANEGQSAPLDRLARLVHRGQLDNRALLGNRRRHLARQLAYEC